MFFIAVQCKEKEGRVSELQEVMTEDDTLNGKPGEEEIIGIITEYQNDEEEPTNLSNKVVLKSKGIVLRLRPESLRKPEIPAHSLEELWVNCWYFIMLVFVAIIMQISIFVVYSLLLLYSYESYDVDRRVLLIGN